MNIRVDLNTTITDGTEVVFRSPVDCSQITGLILYYPDNGNTSSKEFAFADAHGNNVGDIDHLFAENAVVKVILDLETNMAFVQNADTNAYLEGRLAECLTHTEQTLTEEQKAQARANIGAASEDVVSMIEDAFEYSVVSDNKFDNIFDAPGRFDDADGTGEVASDKYIRTSKYYPIEPKDGKLIYIVKDGTNYANVFWYDKNKSYVGTQIVSSSFTFSQVDVPENTAYFRLYTPVGNMSRYYFSNINPGSAANADYEYKVALARNSVSYKEQTLTNEQKETARKNIGAASTADLEVAGWENCDGELQAGLMAWSGTIESNYANRFAVRIAEVESGASYRITACASESMQIVQFRDESGSVIKRITGEKPASGIFQQYTNYEVEVPTGATTIYVCSCFETERSAYADIETYPIIEKYTPVSIRETVEQLKQGVETAKNCIPLNGKVIVNFGDSIFGATRPPNDISTKLARLTGATVYNCGFGGCRMAKHHMTNYGAFSMYKLADAIVSGDWTEQDAGIADTTQSEKVPSYFSEGLAILKSLDFASVDIITIAYGTNDFTAGVRLELDTDAYDTSRFAGALRYSVEKLLTAYPHLKIFVCSQIYRYWRDADGEFSEDSDTYTNDNGDKLTDFVAKTEEVAKAYHLPYINNYDIGMNKYSRSHYFSATDGTHPLTTGCHLIAQHIAKELF